MKKYLVLCLIAMISTSTFWAQTLSPKVFPTQGKSSTSGGVNLSYTIGETIIPTQSSGGVTLTQGFQQPEIDLLVGTISGNSFCAGASLSVPYNAIGFMINSNVFTAQLSNSTGSFASPVNIGNITGTSSGTISCVIPSNTPSGTGYRIRVVSSAPAFAGGDNGVDITISSLTPTIAGGPIFCGSGVLDAGTYSTYLWDDGSTNEFRTVTTTGTYSVTVTDGNGCQGSAEADITVLPNPAFPEDFEEPIFPPCGWSTSSNTFYPWSQQVGASAYGIGNQSAKMDFWDVYNNSEQLTSFVFAPTTSNFGVQFDEAYASYYNENDQLEIKYSTDGGGTWNSLIIYDGGDSGPLNTGGDDINGAWTPASNEWKSLFHALPSGTNMVQFNGISAYGNNLYLDNVNIVPCSGPDVMISGGPVFCGSGVIDAGVHTTYLWGDNSTNETLTVTSSGTYYVTVSDGNGCTAVASIDITVNANPTPVISANGPTTFCDGGSVTLDAGNYNGYLWSDNSTSETLEVSTSGTYTVTVTDGNGCTGTASQDVVVNPNPTPVIASEYPINQCETSNVLYVTQTFATYLWSDDIHTTYNYIDAQKGTYSVTVTDGNGCSGSSSFFLPGGPFPIIVLTSNNDQYFPHICEGTSYTIQVEDQIYLTGFASYIWNTGATTEQLTISTAGVYNVTVTDTNGCTGVRSLNITSSNISPVITPLGPTTFCQGGYVRLDAGGGYSSYSWSNGETSEAPFFATSGTYTVTVTDNYGCTGSASEVVTVNPNPTPSITGGPSFCGSGVIDAGVYSSYVWGDNSTNETLNVSSTNTYYVTVTDGNGCTGSTSTSITVNANPTPSISGGPIFCNSGVLDAGVYSSYIWGNNSTNETLNVSNSGTYYVTVTDGNGCTGAASDAITVNTSPAQPGAITGNTTLCANSVQTYSIAVVAGATGYTWTLPSGWSGSSSTNSITVTAGTSGGTVSVTADNSCGSSPAQTLNVTVNNVPFQPGAITGAASVCSGTSHTYSIIAVSGATSYTWTLPSGWSGSSTTTSINAVSGVNSGNITVTANNACGSSVASVLAVIPSTGIPAQPGVISGNAAPCYSSSQTYSIFPVAGATNYIWTTPAGWTGTSTTTSITVTIGNSNGNITVKASNACGTSSARTFAVTVSHVPAQPGTISGPTPVCNGSTATYSVLPVSGATSYTWTLPSGWSGTSTTDSITVTVGAAGGNIMVKANNSCGSGSTRVLFATVTNVPPAPGTITGSTLVCSGSTQTYSIAPVAGATSYFWTLPSGWTGSSTSTSITCTAGSTGGNVSVLSVNNCGVSNTTRILTVSVSTTPSLPGAITGNTTVCQGTTQTYHIAAVAGATSYTWTLQSGWTGTSTTVSITATVGSSSGNVSVVANNNCGTSASSTLAVTTNSIPAQPGAISGNTSVCQGTVQTYSVSPVAGATSYTWTKPAGWSGTSTTNSITFTVNATGGNLTAKATNSCGSSPVQSLAVSANAITAVTITGNPANYNFCSQIAPTSVVMIASAGYSSYAWSPSGGNAQTATVNAANTYTVTATNGAGCTTTASKVVTNNCALPTSLNTTNILGTSAKATWVQSQCRYNYTIQISVHGLNSWAQYTVSPSTSYTFTGLSLSTSYDWQIQTNCNTSGTINSGWSAIQTFTTAAQRMANGEDNSTSFNIYPNPASEMLTLTFSSMDEGSYSVKMIDMMGRVVNSEFSTATIGENSFMMNLDGIAKGIYMVVMQKGDIICKAKLVVE